jgi:ribosome maturation factor RimP
LREYSLELVDVEYLRERGGWIVRITIDKEGHVTMGDCTKVSRELGFLMEVKEVIERPYNLEVSSPGLDRPLKTEKDFERFVGKKITIRTVEPLDGQRNFKGTLRSIKNGQVTLDNQEKTWRIPFKAIAKAKLIYEFPQ